VETYYRYYCKGAHLVKFELDIDIATAGQTINTDDKWNELPSLTVWYIVL